MQLQAPVVDNCGSPAYNNDCLNDFTPVTDLPYCSQVVFAFHIFLEIAGFLSAWFWRQTLQTPRPKDSCRNFIPIACLFRATRRNLLLTNGTMYFLLVDSLFAITTYFNEYDMQTRIMHICEHPRWQYPTYPCTYRDGPGLSGTYITATDYAAEIHRPGAMLTLVFELHIHQVLCRTAPSTLPPAFPRTWTLVLFRWSFGRGDRDRTGNFPCGLHFTAITRHLLSTLAH